MPTEKFFLHFAVKKINGLIFMLDIKNIRYILSFLDYHSDELILQM